jgi:DNA ligase-4
MASDPYLQRDRERATYGLKETALAKCYVEVLGLDPKSEAGHRLIHWKQPRPGDVSPLASPSTDGELTDIVL